MSSARSPKAIFRCDASPEIGGGHVLRCLTLADALKEKGYLCAFASDPATAAYMPLIKQKGYALTQDGENNTDLLIVDHYGLDAEYEKNHRPKKRVIVIDDLANRKHDCDILIDQTLNRDPLDYKNLVSENCRVLAGTEYALLRPQFSSARENSLKRRDALNGKVERIFVFTSSMDKDDIAGKIISALSGYGRKLSIDIVLGGRALYLENVRNLTAASRHALTVHTDIDDMAGMMAAADIAIGAGGTTSWERCCMGLPALVFEIADNQKTIISNLGKAGAVRDLGGIADINEETLCPALKDLDDNPQKVVEMSKAARTICDGQGTHRVITEILK